LVDPLNLPALVTAGGHPAIRASHAKTLELTAEPAITGRASCVVGVAARLPAQPVAGPIRLTLSVAGQSVSWRATGNSGWWPGSGSAVIRRSGRRLPDTFATDAELAAADLPRPLAEALAAPDATVTLQVERAAGSTGVLVRCRLAGLGPDRVLAEAAAAELVLAEDAAARSWLASAGVPAVPASTGHTAGAAARLADGGRVLAVAGGAGTDLTELLLAAGAVEVLGLPAELAVSAAAADRSAALHADGVRPRELPALAAAHPSLALVFRCPADRLSRLLAELGRGSTDLVLAPVDDPERPIRGRPDELTLPDRATLALPHRGTLALPHRGELALPHRGELACRVAGSAQPAGGPAIEPAALVRQLLAQSVSPRTVALAVAALPGWSRRSAYEFVLARSAESAIRPD
jgi:hypothetical protein